MKKWLVRGGLVVLCGVIVLVVLHVRGRMALSQKIAELKAQGLPTSFAELEAQSRLPEGTPNAADIYMKAFAAYRPLADAEKQKLLPVMGERPEPEASEPYPQEQMDAAREFVEQNQEMFRLLHEAGQVETCYYPMDYSMDSPLSLALLEDFKTTCRSLQTAVIYYLQTNQSSKACQAIIDQLRMGQSLNNLFVVIHLTKLGAISLGIIDIERTANTVTLSESDLLVFQNILQGIDNTIKSGSPMKGELCYCMETCNKLFASLSIGKRLILGTTGVYERNMVKLLDSYQKLIEVDKLPLQDQLHAISKVFKAIEKEPDYILLPRIILSGLDNFYLYHLGVRANMGCAITALAIERYRMKEGKLPETVEALVPEYLPAVYMDPFDGQPLRYEREGAGYMVYTIGADGVDDGGRKEDPDNPKETFDWVFRVER
ncbi:MAG TPA: hypothetical protein PKB02_19160 [Anaerohalosphaeraceae bacterium]|nr:hypothetical protein [Anaerohalosphaeraceae bacterium]